VWYNPKSVPNIFSMADMEREYKIIYNPGALTVHIPHNNATFT
jgi:hypothetical protein